MLPLFCFTLLLLGQSLASRSSNQYIDTVVSDALRNVIRNKNLDPNYLLDYTYEFKDEAFFGKAGGKAVYTEGTLTGLSRVQRQSECQGPITITGRTVINCTLSIRSLKTSYKGRVKYDGFPEVTINAKGNVENTIIDVEVAKPFNQGIQAVARFRSVGKVTTEFTGLGLLNSHMKFLDENYRARIGYDIAEVINSRFSNALEIAARQVPMPLL